ncbi:MULTISPECIES: hypothetical protein [unclassified Streptomyces]|nr:MULTISPECIES: hypothetical protein [unclassified Streptomyces]
MGAVVPGELLDDAEAAGVAAGLREMFCDCFRQPLDVLVLA